MGKKMKIVVSSQKSDLSAIASCGEGGSQNFGVCFPIPNYCLLITDF